MQFYTYIYGRTLNIDFREICTSPLGLSDNSKALIKQLLNTDVVSNGAITRQRYLFIREDSQVIFGVGINHLHFLDKPYQTDMSGRRGLRSFIGIIIDCGDFNEIDSIPVNPNFYVRLYLKQIAEIWDLDDRPKNRKVLTSTYATVMPEKDWLNLNGTLSFNNDYTKCRFFSKNEETLVLSSLKNCRSSVMIGLNNEGHVISAAKRFNDFIPNALCDDTLCTKTISLNNEISSVKGNTSNSGAELDNTKEGRDLSTDDHLLNIWGETDNNNVSSEDLPSHSPLSINDGNTASTNTDKPQIQKKGYRLKLVVLGAIILAFSIGVLVGRCSKLNPQKSVSGDSTQIVKTMHKK